MAVSALRNLGGSVSVFISVRVLIVVVGVLLLAACAQEVKGAGPRELGLQGRTFLSTAVTEDGKPRQLVDGTRITLTFHDDGRVSAQAGCNILGSDDVSTDDGVLSIGSLSQTEMGCDPPRHDQDEWLASVLTAKPTWKLDSATLLLETERVAIMLQDREVVFPDLGLEGTRWTLDTLVDGDVASSMPQGISGSLRFVNGRVQVDTGCNRGTTNYEVTGTTIRFEGLGLTKKMCTPEAGRVEKHVVDVLSGEVSFEIESDRLTLGHGNKQIGLHGRR